MGIRGFSESNIKICDSSMRSGILEFMLGMLRNALKEISETNSGTSATTNEEKIIALLKLDDSMSANMLSVSIGITGRQAQRILAKLKGEGRIIRHGANKNGYWEVINR